jgi:hypothetical protein
MDSLNLAFIFIPDLTLLAVTKKKLKKKKIKSKNFENIFYNFGIKFTKIFDLHSY